MIDEIQSNTNDLKEIIQKYKDFLNEHMSAVADGEQLLALGAKTSIIKEIEELSKNNPMQNLANIKTDIDQKILHFLDCYVTDFLVKSKQMGLVQSAFKKIRTGCNLYYGIVLVEDNFTNRDKIFEFLHFYYTHELSEKLPIYFQFMSPEVFQTFKQVEKFI